MATSIGVDDYGGAEFARIVATPVASGSQVRAGQILFEIENHKVNQEIEAPGSGRLIHRLAPGDLVRPGASFAYILEDGEAEPDNDPAPLPAQGASAESGVDGAPLSVLKATELASLGSGAAHSMMSVLGAHLGPVVRSGGTMDFFRNKILDLVAFEASRLLAGDYARLNAFYQDGHVVERTRVSAGVAFDEGGRLTVCAIPDSDKISLKETQEAVLDRLMRYMGKALGPEDTSSATFTISDLSASPLTFSFPLLPRGQCVIIAVLRSEAGDYNLIASFDHRVTEGLLVSAFLMELVSRLRSFAQSLEAPSRTYVCSFCDKSLQEETGPISGRGLVKIIDASGSEALCCSACWGGW
jgi:pyruvate/2-oxoglutarate dehydrogenase complex dihydrolipoamide acyltransferase (E2) component